MKKIFLLVILLALITPGFAQQTDSTAQIADAIEKLFSWHTEKSKKGNLMFLDVPYQREESDSTEFLRLTVAKDSGRIRPDYIMVTVPGDVSRADGVFIKFAKTVVKGGEQTIALEDGDPVRVNLDSCDNDNCTARLNDGLTTNENGAREDIFRKFISFDHVFFLFMYADGSHKSVAVPLFSFQQQYPRL